MVIAAIYPLGLVAGGICSIHKGASGRSACDFVARLDSVTPFSATARYAVTLPQAEDDIVYTVRLLSEATPADTLCEARYLIDWELPRPETVSRGFSSYSDGNHFRYNDNKLQEYHFKWDSIPFQVGRGGVQRSPQFVGLLPQMMARELRDMLADTTFTLRFVPDTVVSGRHVTAFRGVQNVRGYDGRYFDAFFDPATARPLRVSNEFNPGQISEQSVTVEYTYPAEGGAVALPATEEELIALYPEVFEKFRSSNYRVENLRGEKLPRFSLPSLGGERYSYDPSRGFRAPAVIALLDPAVTSAAETVALLRKAVRSGATDADLLLVFTGGNPDTVENIAGQSVIGEYALLSGRSLARDCGVTVFPTVMVCDSNGVVREVLLGFNRNLAENVIQAVALAQE